MWSGAFRIHRGGCKALKRGLTRPQWDDEDNNPYASFHRRDSETSDIASPTERAYPAA